MHTDRDKYLRATSIIDSDSKIIIDYAMSAIEDKDLQPVTKAVKLYYAVRDDIWYDPYIPFYRPEHYRSSNVLKKRPGFLYRQGRSAVCPRPGLRHTVTCWIRRCSQPSGHPTIA